jgi:hypothetical protein
MFGFPRTSLKRIEVPRVPHKQVVRTDAQACPPLRDPGACAPANSDVSCAYSRHPLLGIAALGRKQTSNSCHSRKTAMQRLRAVKPEALLTQSCPKRLPVSDRSG